jgi:hypothetical protein
MDPEDAGFAGAWYTAIVIHVDKGRYTVQYDEVRFWKAHSMTSGLWYKFGKRILGHDLTILCLLLWTHVEALLALVADSYG